jgi:hypothetical protein
MLLYEYHDAAIRAITKNNNTNINIINNNQKMVVELLHNCSNYVLNLVAI